MSLGTPENSAIQKLFIIVIIISDQSRAPVCPDSPPPPPPPHTVPPPPPPRPPHLFKSVRNSAPGTDRLGTGSETTLPARPAGWGEVGGRKRGGGRSMERTNSPHNCLARHLSQGGGCNRPELQPEGAGPTAGTANRQKYDEGVLSPFLTGRMFVRPNILRTLRRTMIRFLIEHLLRRIWFGQSRLYFILNWLVMRCKLRPELAADAQQTA